ncbi:MAG: glycosyltransferase [Dehalococcoidia bacterium]|nr:glycosyltransferase [Dehalococcoidia bacterium]
MNSSEGVPVSASLRVSLIVPCYSPDRIRDIIALIDSIECQTLAPYEVIFVVQHSEEVRTAVESRISGARTAGWRVLFLDGNPGVSKARNAGVERASGEIIGFVDDDAVLYADWVERTVAAYLAHPDMIGVAGAIKPLWDAPNMEWFPRELYWMVSCTYWDAVEPMQVRNGYGANLSFRRAAFDADRCFDENLGIGPYGSGGWRSVGGEEPEFSLRVMHATGKHILYVPDVQVRHRVRPYRLKSRTIARRAYWEGRFKAILLARSAKSLDDVLHTEHALLRLVVRNSLKRTGLLFIEPYTALRQKSTVAFVLMCLACGYVEGRLRDT